MKKIEIIGICFIKNEDMYIERVLKNVANFCDHVRVIDNGSTDDTVERVKKCVKEHSNISLEFFWNIAKSHKIVEQYAGLNKWVFGVDGDEIYDPVGLSLLRPKILAGKYQKCWMLRGYFYHVIKLNMDSKHAVGYLAPPSKDPNKLYNFSLLKSWKSDKVQPLFHCPTRVFKDAKYNSGIKPKKMKLYKKTKWETCPLRCVHVRMIERSSLDNYKTFINSRINLSNTISNEKYNLRRKYRDGKKIKKDISNFFI